MNRKVRVRFAPSPTGPLHIGGVRTALYNFLFAKHFNGDFVLRIEDTDQMRYVPGTEEYIIESLTWLGINFNEGVHCGGQYSPYRQSERKDIYRKYAFELIEKGYAYYAFDTQDELETMRKKLEAEKSPNQQYDSVTRKTMRNSLTMSKEEVSLLINRGDNYVIRIKIPENEIIHINDIIRGEVVVNSNTLDDKVLFKSDGMPTYHLANVVDDHLMNITHVIRGEEWLPSAPLHFLLYKFFGWSDSMPYFAHLPLLLKPDGNGKLSKRDGDRLGFPVFPIQWKDPVTGEVSSGYRESGYYPEAVINILAFLGWNPGTEKEIFSIDELCSEFSLERITKAGAKFSLEKAKWYNQQYFRQINTSSLVPHLVNYLQNNGFDLSKYSNEKLAEIIDLVRERAVFQTDLFSLTRFFFFAPDSYDNDTIRKKWKPDTNSLLKNVSEIISEKKPETDSDFESELKNWMNEMHIPLGNVMLPLRICLVGGTFGPDLFSIMRIIGREEVIKRINKAIDIIT